MAESKNVIIVEDNQELSRMYERAFRLHGYDVTIYDEGEKALQGITAGENPAAIVMDVIIPKMSGIDLLRNVRNNHRLDSVPILVLTNSFNEGNKEQFLSLGADMYLVKIEHEAADVVLNVEALIQKHAGLQETKPASNGSILLVEDDEYIARVYDRAFRMSGFSLTPAADGEIALHELNTMASAPSAIIMDIGLPKLGGEELFKDIRADARYKSVPIVILTNSFRGEDKDKFLSLGADLFLVKIENTPVQIVEKIAKLIAKK